MRIILALSALVVAASQTVTCTDYCGFMATNCAATFTGSDVTASCMAECAFFPANATAGEADKSATNTGNNLGCRTYHAEASATDAAVHCPHARPDSTLCKSAEATAKTLTSGTCDNYCDQMKMTCPTSLLGADRAGCINACSRFADQNTPAGSFPIPSSATGDIGCRLYHVFVARTDATSAATHCPHADLTGGGVCPNTFCANAVGACTTAQTGYADATSCANIWMNIPAGNMADTTGDTQGCRAYHLSVSLRSAALADAHCNHTGQSGNPACGNDCAAYCSQYSAACNNTGYTNMAACTTACAAFSATGMRGATGGNTLQCRLYHLGVAQQSAALAATHCPHAAQSGGGVCGTAPSPTASASTAAVSILALAAPLLAFFRNL